MGCDTHKKRKKEREGRSSFEIDQSFSNFLFRHKVWLSIHGFLFSVNSFTHSSSFANIGEKFTQKKKKVGNDYLLFFKIIIKLKVEISDLESSYPY